MNTETPLAGPVGSPCAGIGLNPCALTETANAIVATALEVTV